MDEEFKIDRTGDAPLAFRGELVAEEAGAWHAGVQHNRWHDLAIHKTAGGKFVVSVIYQTQWQGELDHADAQVCASLEEACQYLREYDPLKWLGGFPPGAQYEEKQRRLRESLSDRYRDRLGDLLKAVGAEERID